MKQMTYGSKLVHYNISVSELYPSALLWYSLEYMQYGWYDIA